MTGTKTLCMNYVQKHGIDAMLDFMLALYDESIERIKIENMNLRNDANISKQLETGRAQLAEFMVSQLRPMVFFNSQKDKKKETSWEEKQRDFILMLDAFLSGSASKMFGAQSLDQGVVYYAHVRLMDNLNLILDECGKDVSCKYLMLVHKPESDVNSIESVYEQVRNTYNRHAWRFSLYLFVSSLVPALNSMYDLFLEQEKKIEKLLMSLAILNKDNKQAQADLKTLLTRQFITSTSGSDMHIGHLWANDNHYPGSYSGEKGDLMKNHLVKAINNL